MDVITIAIIIFCALIGVSTVYVAKYPPDNPIEEAMEKIIEDELHVPPGSIDLSPGTPEKK